MKSVHGEERSFIEIECPAGSETGPFAFFEVQALLDRLLGEREDGKVRIRTSEEDAGSVVHIRCSGGTPGQWEVLKERLREQGLLEKATIYQHHPALKCRTQIWP